MAAYDISQSRLFRGILAMVFAVAGSSGVDVSSAAERRFDRPSEKQPPDAIYVDGVHGNDSASGISGSPLQSLSAAIWMLPDPLKQSVTIHLLGGKYESTGGHDMAGDRLELVRRMRPGVTVRIVGEPDSSGARPILAWEGNSSSVDVREGDWWLENVQVGSGSTRQRRGVMAMGPGQVTLKNVTFRTRSQSDAGIWADRGGLVSLRGDIKLNEHLHDNADSETFAGIIAENHGLVQFVERERASLDIGNGSLSCRYYGIIQLGCETARITSWGEQSNCLAINNGGRIDLHNTKTTLCAKQRQNTPIGLEHDGHILAEGARIIVEGTNQNAIVLQKSSTLTCNDIELRGTFETAASAMSGSMFVGRFIGDVAGLSASTSASINVEELKGNGKITGAVTATSGAVISLPDRVVSGR